MINSPLKGIEKLSEDLKNERQKANNALQERARLRIELESLKQLVSRYEGNENNWTTEINLLKSQIAQQTEELSDEKRNLSQLQDGMTSRSYEIAHLNNEYNSVVSDLTLAKEVLKEKEDIINSQRAELDARENEVVSKDRQIHNLREDTLRVRNDLENAESALAELNKLVISKQNSDFETQSRLKSFGALEQSYLQSKQANTNLRKEIESLLESNSKISQDLRHLSNKCSEMVNNEGILQQQISNLTAERDALAENIAEYDITNTELSRRTQAEIDAKDAAIERAEAAARGREFLESQLHELRGIREQAIDHSTTLEEQLAAARVNLHQKQAEIQHLKDRLEQAEAKADQSNGLFTSAAEVDLLRSQLNEVRKQLMKRDVDDGAGLTSPRMLLDRDSHGRQVYENIISDLRAEVDRANSQFLEVNRRLEEAQRKAARVTQLEEEIEMYREMATNVSIESQSAAQSASEAVERSIKVSHESRHFAHDIQRREAELLSARSENKSLQEEILSLRDKMKSFHLSKLTADRKTAELLTSNSKLETTLEELRQKLEFNTMEMEKQQREAKTLLSSVNEAKQRLQQCEKEKNDLQALKSQINETKSSAGRKEAELSLELQTLHQSKASLMRELDLIRNSFELEKNHAKDCTVELSNLRNELELMTDERNRYKKEAAQRETLRAEQQLQELRRDLEATVTDWRSVEKERDTQGRLNMQLQAEILKEREKYTVLKMQNTALQDRLRVVTQELQVYKSIDIYHSSMKVELETLRFEKEKNGKISINSDPKIQIETRSEEKGAMGGSSGKNSIYNSSPLTIRAPPDSYSSKSSRQQEESKYVLDDSQDVVYDMSFSNTPWAYTEGKHNFEDAKKQPDTSRNRSSMDSNFSQLDSFEQTSPRMNGSQSDRFTLAEFALSDRNTDPFASSTRSIQSTNSQQWSPTAARYQNQTASDKGRNKYDDQNQPRSTITNTKEPNTGTSTSSNADHLKSKRTYNLSNEPGKFVDQSFGAGNSFQHQAADDASCYTNNSNSSSKSSRIAAREEFIRQKIIADRQIANAKVSVSTSNTNMNIPKQLNVKESTFPVQETSRYSNANNNSSTLQQIESASGRRTVNASNSSTSLKVPYMAGSTTTPSGRQPVLSSSNSVSSSYTTGQSDASTASSSSSNNRNISNYRPSKSDFEKARRLLSR